MPIDNKYQRVVVAMIDGFGLDYLEATPMPNLRRLMAEGFYRPVSAVFPSVTNVNNASISCGRGLPSTGSAPTPTLTRRVDRPPT